MRSKRGTKIRSFLDEPVTQLLVLVSLFVAAFALSDNYIVFDLRRVGEAR